MDEEALAAVPQQLATSTTFVYDRIKQVAKGPHPCDKHLLPKLSDCYKEVCKVDLLVKKAGSPPEMVSVVNQMLRDYVLAVFQAALPTAEAELAALDYCSKPFMAQDLADLYKHAMYVRNPGHVPVPLLPALLTLLGIPSTKGILGGKSSGHMDVDDRGEAAMASD